MHTYNREMVQAEGDGGVGRREEGDEGGIQTLIPPPNTHDSGDFVGLTSVVARFPINGQSREKGWSWEREPTSSLAFPTHFKLDGRERRRPVESKRGGGGRRSVKKGGRRLNVPGRGWGESLGANSVRSERKREVQVSSYLPPLHFFLRNFSFSQPTFPKVTVTADVDDCHAEHSLPFFGCWRESRFDWVRWDANQTAFIPPPRPLCVPSSE
ncbi:hypothetical protein IE53DRAFT_279616 [Violaceomyces palustris]|uniref:Uncharacterized protein n=1 Tax=Violaceomyces palustris TaxID=1673888 RepID=A0ACD0NMG6_9BASI|nr:hypothetical protein IE53DRAFT_279616 [Violaceomyces palustris]